MVELQEPATEAARRPLTGVLGASLAMLLAAGAAAPVWGADESRVLFRFSDARITESSGLADGGDVVWTVNDSGDVARIFMVAKATGRTVGVTTYADEAPVDVEALAAGPDGTLWVGDIGDNGAVRGTIRLYRLPTPARGDRQVTATAYDLVYPDGARDAETLLVAPRTGRVFVVSKAVLGGAVYAAPPRLREDRPNRLVRVAEAPALVTDGVFTRDGLRVLLRDYRSVSVLRTRDFMVVERFGLPAQPQGEAIAVAGDGRALVSSEGAGTPVYALRLGGGTGPDPEPPPSPAPQARTAGTDDQGSGDERTGVSPRLLGLGVAAALALAWALRRRRR